MRVLLVDDDRIFLMICEKLIRMTNFSSQIHICMNGKEAIDHLYSKSDQKDSLPEVILLDINMPILNGWDFLDEYINFAQSNNVDIPVIIISSTVHSIDTEKAQNYDCIKGFFTKPLSLEDMEAMKAILK